MRIVQINCSASGSTGNIAKAIHRQLLKLGNDSYIFYETGCATEQNMFRVGNYFDLHIHSVLSRNFGKQGYFSHVPTWRLVKKLRKINPQIVHLHNLHGSYLNLPILFRYLRKSGVQVIITLHDCWLFTGKCPHFANIGCEQWKKTCGNCQQLSIYPRSKVDTTKKSLADKKNWISGFGDKIKIVAVSNWLRDVAKQSYLSQYSIETIYNGVNGDIFRPVDGSDIRRKYGLEDRYIILGISSNWNEQKGLGDFLSLSKQLSENEVIVLVGLTSKQIETLPKNIIGMERTDNQEELAALYSAADVFVNTSRTETFGMVTAEAMACGTPVIVYDSTACAEIVNEECGFVIPNKDKSDLLEYIRMAKQRPLNKSMLFSEKEMVKNYLDLYGRNINEVS